MNSATHLLYDNINYLYFSGTSYLGLNFHEAYIELLKEGLTIYGTNYGGSRRSDLSPDFYREFEAYFADLHGFEASILCTSGTLAAHTVIQSIPIEDTLVLLKGSHPCLNLGTSHNKIICDSIEELLDHFSSIRDHLHYRHHIFIESINAIGVFPIIGNWLAQLPANIPISIIIDDSHGIGILDLHQYLIELPDYIDCIIIASLGKAYATPKGIIFSSHKVKESIMKTSLWGGSSPGSIADIYAILHGKEIIEKQKTYLSKNIAYFRSKINISRYAAIDSFPVFRPINHSIAAKLKEEKILISSFAYPSNDDPEIERIIINAAHSLDQIDKLIQAMNVTIR